MRRTATTSGIAMIATLASSIAMGLFTIVFFQEHAVAQDGYISGGNVYCASCSCSDCRQMVIADPKCGVGGASCYAISCAYERHLSHDLFQRFLGRRFLFAHFVREP